MSVMLNNTNQSDWTVKVERAKEFKRRGREGGAAVNAACHRFASSSFQWVTWTLPGVKRPERESGNFPM
jgi:hypothetical protein